MTALTNAELNSLCTTLKSTPAPFYEVAQVWLQDLYNTGCRPHELLAVDRWTYFPFDGGYYEMLPFKGNFLRRIEQADISTDLQDAIAGNYKPYWGLTVRQLEYSMKQINPAGKMTHETKDMVAYIFRYNRCKLLWDSGAPASQIQEYFGWKNPPIAWDYGSAVIEVANWPI